MKRVTNATSKSGGKPGDGRPGRAQANSRGKGRATDEAAGTAVRGADQAAREEAASSPGASGRTKILVWAVVLLVAVAGFALRAYRANEAFSGFHAFNEGFYTMQALGYANGSLLSAFYSPGDFNNPPLFSVLVALVLRVTGFSPLAVRMVPMLASFLLVLAVFKLGKELYSQKVGMLAAVIVSFTPGLVLVGRNVQTDALVLLLVVTSTYLYVRGTKSASLLRLVLAGVVFGLALDVKITAVLALPCLIAWRLVETRRLSAVVERRSIAFYAAAVLVGVPWYLYQLVAHPDLFLGQQSHLVGTIDVPGWTFLRLGFFGELVWMVSPVLAFLLLVALIYLIASHKRQDFLVASLLFVYTAFYLFYHYHTYYLVMIAPFVALAVARALEGFGVTTWARVGTAGGLLCITLVGASLLVMSVHKYGDDGLDLIEGILDRTSPGAKVQATYDFTDNVGPAVTPYLSRPVERLAPLPDGKPSRADSKAAVIGYNVWRMTRPAIPVPKTSTRLVLFGYALTSDPRSVHVFDVGHVRFERVDGLGTFGVQDVEGEPVFVVWPP